MKNAKKLTSTFSKIAAWDSKKLNFNESVELFQSLIDQDVLKHLHVSYQVAARRLLETGFCEQREARQTVA